MSKRNLKYWNRGFSYHKNRIGNRVIIETYRILMHYTSENPNCRVGVYLTKTHFSEFYTLEQIFPEFDRFIEIATTDKKVIDSDLPQFLKEINGIAFYEQIQSVMKLKWPIYFQYQSQNLISKIIGYNFKNSLDFKINPDEIKSLEGESLDSFRIKVKDSTLDIRFRNQISIN
ncbi:hypothetical protein MBM09_07450 [Flaviramulus sp. BrNp1-15]|uniref:hypothetical protein n=1 Tax=Flaviramulus sp. BrNp1-15 TaxID=2916754 RepID=UPI001EE7C051|nr:hypothetical protein [Flaviramulus sp. BrNp1-15]ULC60825.1 hypothetical protein MBM09_07450 [Flaviramulus sp. BrNp1-15]